MKGPVAAMALALSFALISPVHAEPGVESAQRAWAMFEQKPRHGMVPNIGVFINETRSGQDVSATFTIMRGFCAEGSTGMDECAVSSNGFVSGVLESDQYEIDPLLRTATLDLLVRGRRYELAWAAGDPIQPEAFETYCESGDPSLATRAGFSAAATGTIANKKVTTTRSGLENLTFVSACPD